MSLQDLLPLSIWNKFESHEWKNASAILASNYPEEWQEILKVLEEFSLFRSEVERPGGRKSPVAGELTPPSMTEIGGKRSFQPA